MKNPGKYKHLIDIQQNTAKSDNAGQKAPASWSNVTGLTSLWASITTTGGKEFYTAQRTNAEITTLIELRYIAGITAKMRVKYGSRAFDIIYSNNVDEKNETWLLSCKEVV
jgi:SPP1 family predicted phage head-tail adaptor